MEMIIRKYPVFFEENYQCFEFWTVYKTNRKTEETVKKFKTYKKISKHFLFGQKFLWNQNHHFLRLTFYQRISVILAKFTVKSQM